MIRLLTAGTAIVALLATGALAQSSSSSMPMASDSGMSSAMDMSSSAMGGASDMGGSSAMTSSAMTSSAMTSSVMSSQMTTASSMESSVMAGVQPFAITSGYAVVSTDQLATKIIGAHVYDGAAQNANDLGKINDLVINKDGTIAAVVLGVGGFLGIGEKQVAVDFHALQWTTASDNTSRFVLTTTKDELTQAPDFKTVDNAPVSNVTASGAAPAPDANAMGASSSAQ